MQLLGVRLGSRMTYAALRGFPSKSRIDTRTQTEGPSPYWYKLNTTSRQADTTSTGTVTFFLTYHCARNGLPLGPSSLLRHPLPSRTDYDSYTSF
jgi:hypothetical protein